MEKGRCKGCGRPIIWARNITGKMIPLDALASVYLHHESARTCSPVSGVYVSHFNTCPKANDFSKPKLGPCNGCRSTFAKCETAKRHGAVACCPDCRHDEAQKELIYKGGMSREVVGG